MKESVIILGARGRFGRAALEAFHAAGWSVTAALRPGSELEAPSGVQVTQVDALDAAALREACAGHDVIVNALNPSYERWVDLLPKITRAVLAAAESSGATVLIPGNVYNFGTDMPPLLDEHTPQAAEGKGALRIEMESAYRAAGVPTIVLRAGDFIEGRKTGNWFDSFLTKKLETGTLTYPGPMNRRHAWAYLPDLGRAAVQLAERRGSLPRFADIPFPGFSVSGNELQEGLEAATQRSLAVNKFPWWALKAAAVVLPLPREVVKMRYLWETPHELSGESFRRILPDFRATPFVQALAEATGQEAPEAGVLAKSA